VCFCGQRCVRKGVCKGVWRAMQGVGEVGRGGGGGGPLGPATNPRTLRTCGTHPPHPTHMAPTHPPRPHAARAVYSYRYISGGHLNPTVSLAAAMSGHMDWGRALFYAVAHVRWAGGLEVVGVGVRGTHD
jgi:hypothetical protein